MFSERLQPGGAMDKVRVTNSFFESHCCTVLNITVLCPTSLRLSGRIGANLIERS